MPRSIEIRIIVWIYLLNITAVVVRGQVPLPNAVIKINGQTMLDCSTNDLAVSNWRHTPDGVSNFSTISVGCNPVTGNYAAYYRTEVLGGNICRLFIANVTMQQAGVYVCYYGALNTYQSLVTVVDPIASIVVYNQSEVVDGDQLNISCSLNYTAQTTPAPSLRPSLYWTTTSGQNFTNATYHPSTNVVTLVATVRVQKYTVPVFQCKTVFEITGNISTYNPTPPPDNVDIGSTTALGVQYPVEPISITSTVSEKENCVHKPENLTCRANANPPAQYKWLDLKNNTATPGDVISISTGGDYQCIASNSIRSQTHNETKNVTQTSCYPVYNLTMSGSNCTNNSCACNGNQSSFILTCTALGNPEPMIEWLTDVENMYQDFRNGTIVATVNGEYDCIASNEYGGTKYNKTSTEPFSLTYCAVSSFLIWLTILIYPGLGWILGGLFLIYYFKKKSACNKQFSFLKKMLPCMNTDVSATTFERCGWIILYILMVTFAGIFVIPFMFIKVQFFSSASTADVNNVELSATAHPENNAPPPKETIVNEKTDDENVVKKTKKKKKRKKVTD